MARTRNIKPGFFVNEVLGECNPLARLLFAGLWCHADRDGRLEDRPARFKSQILPYDACNVPELLDQLCAAGFITRYEVHGCNYIQINKFHAHQKPHGNEPSGGFPSPSCQNASVIGPKSDDSDQNPTIALSLKPSALSRNPQADNSSESPQAAPSEPPVLIFPTNGKVKSWNLTRAKVDEYLESFPGIDVMAECRAALQWCRDNKPRRKTANGMPAFLGRWLSKANNKPRGDPSRDRKIPAGVNIDDMEL